MGHLAKPRDASFFRVFFNPYRYGVLTTRLDKYVSLKGLIPRSTGVRPLVIVEDRSFINVETALKSMVINQQTPESSKSILGLFMFRGITVSPRPAPLPLHGSPLWRAACAMLTVASSEPHVPLTPRRPGGMMHMHPLYIQDVPIMYGCMWS